MKKIEIEGLKKGCSQLIIDSECFSSISNLHTIALLNTYFQSGGNAIRVSSSQEELIGRWINEIKCREDVVLIKKGERKVSCTAETIDFDVRESLQKLQTDYLDIYLLQGDHDSPVEQIINEINRVLQHGRVKVIGVLNWETARIQKANDYAKRNQFHGIAVNSADLSLAKSQNSKPLSNQSKLWYKQTKFPLMTFSAQAEGFFTGKYSPEKLDKELMDFNCDVNWERYKRAQRLAWDKGVTTNQIALSYVLQQPFPVCAIIQPSEEDELAFLLSSCNVTLSSTELNALEVK